MTKSNKSATTIRRRRNKPLLGEFLSKMRKSQPASDRKEAEEEVIFYKEVLQSSVIEKIMSSDKTIFWGLLVVRIVNSMLIQTSFVPDEFWQSTEVAHKMIFDYGYITWEWKVGIRSYAYPLLFAAFYKVLEMFGLDSRLFVIRGPRLLQGTLASVGDLYLYFLSRRLAGRDVAQWTLLCQLLSWFTGYCCTRTLSNSMETVLVTAALFYFPWLGTPQPKGYSRRFVLLAALSVVIRPTAAVIWILLCSWHLQQSRGTAIFSVLRLYIVAGLTVLGVSTVIDRVWYGEWVLVHLNFLQFNVLSGGSEYYGRHPWHWYLTQGLPVVLGAHSLPFVVGAWHAKNKVLLWIVIWKVFVLSFLAHKEFRFLLPVLPLAMHYCGVCFHFAMKPPPPPKRKTINKLTQKVASKQAAKKISDSHETEQGHLQGAGEPNVKAVCNGKDDAEKEGLELSSANANDNKDEKHVNASAVHQQSAVDMRPETADRESSALQPDSVAGLGEGDTAEAISPDTAESMFQEKQPSEGNEESEKVKQEDHKRRARKARWSMLLLAAFNVLPLLYFSLIHQRGTIDVMNFLHDSAVRGIDRTSQRQALLSPPVSTSASRSDILFLMPCHSTPYYSYLHANVSMRFLTCEPNLGHVANYTDEADVFYLNPSEWLKQEYQLNSSRKLPTHVVYFNVLEESIQEFLTLGGYRRCAKFFHTHLPEGRVGPHVLVSCR